MHGRIGNWKAKTAPFTLPDFIGWLETKNPAVGYQFGHCGGECLMGQYMAARGLKWDEGHYGPTCQAVLGFSTLDVLASEPRTFGAALTRARAALKDSSP